MSGEPVAFRTTVNQLCRHVAQAFELTALDLLMADKEPGARRADRAQARQLAMRLAVKYHQYEGLTLKALGALMGGRDHSTVSHALERAQERVDADPAYRKVAERVDREYAELLGLRAHTASQMPEAERALAAYTGATFLWRLNY